MAFASPKPTFDDLLSSYRVASPVRARTPLGERSPNVAPVRQAVTKKPTRAARRTAARRTVAPYAGVPVHSVDRVACRACDAFLLFGECVELLPAGNGFHCAIKAERGLELESLGTLTATPHENAGEEPAKRDRLSCSGCGAAVGVTMALSSESDDLVVDARLAPRALLKAKDVTVDGREPEAWAQLLEARAARGDSDSAQLVARCAALSLAVSRNNVLQTAVCAADLRDDLQAASRMPTRQPRAAAEATPPPGTAVADASQDAAPTAASDAPPAAPEKQCAEPVPLVAVTSPLVETSPLAVASRVVETSPELDIIDIAPPHRPSSETRSWLSMFACFGL